MRAVRGVEGEERRKNAAQTDGKAGRFNPCRRRRRWRLALLEQDRPGRGDKDRGRSEDGRTPDERDK